MIIPINVQPVGSTSRTFPPQLAQFGTDELVLIDLQGFLDVEGDKQGQAIGKLRVDDGTKPTLLIGHHLLEGKLVNLPKPLAVMRRASVTDAEDMTGHGSPERSASTSWNIVAVVKRKMVFSTRPMPMVGRVTPVSSDGRPPKSRG
ncbi:hypothetical protein OBBRIDRAFT_742189 [Obba rivulosa]|uniref:Chromosome transmission fidelity protein 8 n=1 Tax=Obba rivulosa TaxID=1052685 RepID=A0A8E2DEU7_9APHY|nr:hypothetical protein OBBRIDRAFT_742189 [Obba rivulosa]